MDEMSAQAKSALLAVEMVSQFLSAHDMLLVKDGDTLNLQNQNTGEIVQLSKETAIPFVSLPSHLSIPWSSAQPFSPVSKEKTSLFEEEPAALSQDILLEEASALAERFMIKDQAIDAPCADIQPDHSSSHFQFEQQPSSNQQRDRIIIDDYSEYLALRCLMKPARKVAMVVADLRTYNCCEQNTFSHQVALQEWPPGACLVELHLKTTNHLSNNLDQMRIDDDHLTGFFIHVRFYSFDEGTHSYQFLDEISSSPFRTVSHSKLCTTKRRVKKPNKKLAGKRGFKDEYEAYTPY